MTVLCLFAAVRLGFVHLCFHYWLSPTNPDLRVSRGVMARHIRSGGRNLSNFWTLAFARVTTFTGPG
jgi:hypothetical protein